VNGLGCTQLKIRRRLITSSANIGREWLIAAAAAAAAADQCAPLQCNAIQCDGVPSSFLLLMMMSISKHLAHVVSYIDTSKQEEEEEVEKEDATDNPSW
jgi:hypothetical protein